MIKLRKSPVVFNEDDHTYFLGDKQLCGVTSTLIRRAFPDKYKDIDPEVLAEAARKGKELHAAIEFHDQFRGAAEGEDERIGLYDEVKDSQQLTTVANEYLVSDEHRYASSIDIVMHNKDGEICLVDIKTTWHLDRQSTGLQLSIYKRFFEMQNPGMEVRHIYVLWLPNRDHTICEFHELAVVADENIDALIEADIADKPFQFELIPDEWADLERQYAFWSQKKEQAEKYLTTAKERMMSVMQNANIATVRTNAFTVSFIPAKKSTRFDSATFKKENADLYSRYAKETETAASVRVTPKKDKDSN